MALSSLLLPSSQKSIDKDLDALFTAHPLQRPATTASSSHIPKKRKNSQDDKEHPKRSKSTVVTPSQRHGNPAGPEEVAVTQTKKSRGPDRKGKAKRDVDGENSQLEQGYHVNTLADDDPSGSGDDTPVHESLKHGSNKGSRKKTKFVPPDETTERRDQRTIFIGNLSVNVAQKRPLLKQLHRHILAQVPSAKIESTRFRSVPFQIPTSKLEDDTSDPLKSKPAKPQAPPTPAPVSNKARPHDIDRTSTWRERQDEEAAEKTDEKKYLTSSQKKKIAFINHEFHSTADTVNAYVVFAHPTPVVDRPDNLPPLPPVMDPYEAACVATAKCDGSVFMDRVVRVDLVGKKDRSGKDGELGGVETDPKLSVFVGNLDFASKEEDLRVFFDGVISAERGPPESNDGDDDEENETVRKPKTWVARVRVVRDKETQLGKGFAYVQFVDRECVDEVLAIEEGKLKFAKRKLRVQRCKTLPGSSISTREVTSSSSSHPAKSPRTAGKPSHPAVSVTVPKGDPGLGEKLAHLTKEVRKQVKSADADRVARRLAKKKARMALGDKGGVKMLGKERERVRKPGKSGVASAGAQKKAGGRRVRSEKSLAKKNAKKTG